MAILRKHTGNDRSQESDILSLYNKKMSIFKKLGNDKGIEKNQAVMQDILQETVIKVLHKSKGEKIDKLEHFFNVTMRNVTIDKVRKNVNDDKIIEFFNDFEEKTYLDSYQQYAETIDYIKSLLTEPEFVLFNRYHVEGLSQQKISEMSTVPQQNVSRDIKKLNNKLHHLKLKELYRIDFVAPANKDKKMTPYPDYKPKTGVKINRTDGTTAYVYKSDFIDKADYKPQSALVKKPLPEKFNTTGLVPTIDKPLFDDVEYISFDAASINTCVFFRSLNYRGDLNNRYGCMYRWGALNSRLNLRKVKRKSKQL